MRRCWIFLIVISLFAVSCRQHSVSNKSGKDNNPSTKYSQLHVPYIHVQVNKGDWVLAPEKKFLDAYLAGKKNFFWFHPREVDSVGQQSVFVWEIDSLVKVPNAFIISFPSRCDVHRGDFVFTWWQKGSGLQRAYVLKSLADGRIIVRYLDLSATKDPNNLVDTIAQGSFRVIGDDFAPGASVHVHEDKGDDLYVIINSEGDSLVCRSSIGNVKFFVRDSVVPNGVRKQLSDNQQVYVPFYGVYIPGKVAFVKDGYAAVDVVIIDRQETLEVPLLDVFVE